MRDPTQVMSDKHAMRVQMREMRRGLNDRFERSARICDRLIAMSEFREAGKILLFTTIPGEPEMATLEAWCESMGKETAVPEDNVDPGWPDVVVVPGLAFTPEGERLGQGGGWYDRFLSNIRPTCTTIGVGFAQQLVESIPTEPHDVPLDHIVTDLGVASAR
jgi:5-formyltetrahydrofolate cyclo-ligase